MDGLPFSSGMKSKIFVPSGNEGSTITSDHILISKAKGIYLWDIAGKRYCDFFSQTWSLPLGHNNKKVIAAVRNQLKSITHLRTAYSTPEKTELSNRILGMAPGNFSKINFVLHGSLAVEGAIKLAVNHYADRDKILFLEDGFHGRSLMTMGASWKLPDSKYSGFFSNFIETKKDLEDVEKKMAEFRPAAIVMELIQCNAGCRILEKGFVHGVRQLCTKYGVTMIIDEIQTAFGCMGTYFLSEQYAVEPDIVVFGKAIGGGFPLAGTIYKQNYAFQAGDHSFTFAQSPISFAAAVAYLDELKGLIKRTDHLQNGMTDWLIQISLKYPFVKNARCLGLKAAFDVLDEKGEPDCDKTERIVSMALAKGILIANSRYRQLGNTIMMQPPLITTQKQMKTVLANLDDILHKING